MVTYISWISAQHVSFLLNQLNQARDLKAWINLEKHSLGRASSLGSSNVVGKEQVPCTEG